MLDQTLLNSKSPYITPLQKRVLEERVIVTICLMVLDHVQELFKQFIWYSNACMTLASQQVKTRKRICCYIATSNILWIHNNRYRLFIQKCINILVHLAGHIDIAHSISNYGRFIVTHIA